MNQWISVKDRLPAKPGKKNYEHVYCLVFAPREGVLVRPWNCEHLVWDDEDGDDVSCLNERITHWMPIPDEPGTQPVPEESSPISEGLRVDFDINNPDRVTPVKENS